MKYTEFLESLQEADVVARADYKVGPSGRKSHREIVFHDGSGTGKEDEKDEKKEVKEEKMTDAEMKKREDIVKGMKKNVAGFKARYGDRAKEVMYATATKLAKEEVELDEAAANYDASSKAHQAARTSVKGMKSTMKAEYHKDGSASIHTKSSNGISSTRAVDHHHDKAGLGYNRSESDYKSYSAKDKAGLTHTTKATSTGHTIHIKEEVQLEENAPVAPGLVKHRIGVTVSDPNHTMASQRKEKVQKFVRVTHSSNKEGAQRVGEKHFKKKGYVVHDSWHAGMVNEEVISEGAYEKAEENKRSADAAKKQGDMFAHHLHMADHHDNLAQWHSEKGRNNIADHHARKSEEHHEKAMGFKESVDTVKRDASGKVVSWKHEGDWKKNDPKKNPEGKVHNLAGQALKKTKELTKEEVEQIDEIDKSTLASYATKAADSAHVYRNTKRGARRLQGIKKAITRLTKEEVEQIDEKFINGREYASQGVMHPDHAKFHKAGESRDFYAHGTGDKISGKVTKNDGKEVHIQADKSSGGKLHKFKVTPHLPKPVNEETEMTTITYKEFLAKLDEQLLEYTPGPGGVTRHVGTYGTAKGAKYGNTDYDNEHMDKDDDEKKSQPAVKRGRGRPAGSKSGANQKVTTGKSYGGINTHSLHLPNSNR